jgi:hypothetical protein
MTFGAVSDFFAPTSQTSLHDSIHGAKKAHDQQGVCQPKENIFSLT